MSTASKFYDLIGHDGFDILIKKGIISDKFNNQIILSNQSCLHNTSLKGKTVEKAIVEYCKKQGKLDIDQTLKKSKTKKQRKRKIYSKTILIYLI